MKILIRNYREKGYVWKDATWRDFTYYVDDEDYGETGFSSTEILAVKDDNRNGYVVCRHCNTLVRNDPAEIEKHYAEMEAKKDCAKCKYMRHYNDRTNVTVEYVRNEDGTYQRNETSTVKLGCTAGWLTQEVNTAAAKKGCAYVQCRRQGVVEIRDTFVKYPGLFNKSITVDLLEANKCVNEGYKNGHFEYDSHFRIHSRPSGDQHRYRCRLTNGRRIRAMGLVPRFIRVNARHGASVVYHHSHRSTLL